MRNGAVVATALLFAACGGEKLSSSSKSDTGASNFTLTINVAGQGTVTAPAQSITCTSVCAQQFAAGSAVHLDASPSAGMRFRGWSGACSGTAGCDVALSQDTQVGANFGPSSLGTVSVSVVLV